MLKFCLNVAHEKACLKIYVFLLSPGVNNPNLTGGNNFKLTWSFDLSWSETLVGRFSNISQFFSQPLQICITFFKSDKYKLEKRIRTFRNLSWKKIFLSKIINYVIKKLTSHRQTKLKFLLSHHCRFSLVLNLNLTKLYCQSIFNFFNFWI